MVIFGIKMTVIKFPIGWWDRIFKNAQMSIFGDFFIIFTYIFSHSDLDLWPKVIHFNRVWASTTSNYLTKTAFKSVYSFGCNCVHKHKRLNDVIMTSSSIWFLRNYIMNLAKAYLSGIPNLILIGHKRAEIRIMEVNRELREKMDF